MTSIRSTSFARREYKPIEAIYTDLEVIGSGSFGTVYKGYRKGRWVAIKEVIIPQDSQRKHNISLVQHEIDVLQSIKCENKELGCFIVEILDYFYSGNYEIFYLEMSYIEGGDGNDFIKHHKFPATSQYLGQMNIFFYECVSTLKEIHRNCIIHKDIKPENLLYDQKNNHLIYTDFGLSCFSKECRNLGGTPFYWDPSFEFGQRKVYDEYSDIYSLGVTFYKFLTGRNYVEDYIGHKKLKKLYSDSQITLETIGRDFPLKSTRTVMITAIIAMMSPFEVTSRPNLSTIIQAYEQRDPDLIRHLGIEECRQKLPHLEISDFYIETTNWIVNELLEIQVTNAKYSITPYILLEELYKYTDGDKVLEEHLKDNIVEIYRNYQKIVKTLPQVDSNRIHYITNKFYIADDDSTEASIRTGTKEERDYVPHETIDYKFSHAQLHNKDEDEDEDEDEVRYDEPGTIPEKSFIRPRKKGVVEKQIEIEVDPVDINHLPGYIED